MSNTNETFASQGSPNDDDSGQINLFADKTSTLGLTAPVTSPIKNGPILTKDCSNYIGGQLRFRKLVQCYKELHF